MSVDLPDPFWPTSAWVDPGMDDEIDVVERDLTREGLRQLFR
jgi:hypothetical protein